MPPGVFSKLLGSVASFFQIGGPTGPGISVSAGALQAQNAAQSAFVTVSAAFPTADAHLTTKAYVDEIARPFIVTAQSNAASALIANSSIEHYIVVSAAGSGAAAAYVFGAVLWDDGSGVGNVTVLGPTAGQAIFVTTSLTGGTESFSANTEYLWTGSTWANVAPSVAGAVYSIQVALGTTGTTTSVTSLPANAVIQRCVLNVTTAYSAGATIEAGQTGSLALAMGTGDNTPQSVDTYMVDQVTAWGGSALPLVVTIAGGPTAGVGTMTIYYSSPNS
jgi:hypothetical protein